MTLPRQSLSSSHSRESTAIDPQSPTMLDEREKRRRSLHNHTERPASQSATSYSSPARSIIDYKPAERHGWPLLAKVMADVPEYAAFPRFRDLNAKSLLYYQVQLSNLRENILKEEEEVTLHDDLKRYGVLAEKTGSQYHRLMLDLRQTLRGYNEAILQYAQVSALPAPESYDMRSLRSWLTHPEGGDLGVSNKQGLEQTWGDQLQQDEGESLWTQVLKVVAALLLTKAPPKSDCDLVVTQPEAKVDGLTKWTVYYLVPLYWSIKRRWKARKSKDAKVDEEKNTAAGQHNTQEQNSLSSGPLKKEAHTTLESFSEHTALRFTSRLSTVIACLTPVIAIAVLAQVKGMRNLLLCITGFAVMFAILLIFLTQGTTSRTEIFTATAAFSAVLVVFISQPPVTIQMPPGTVTPVINL